MVEQDKLVVVNGLAGRIGRLAAHELIQRGMRLAAGNDLASTDQIVESLAHKDGVHGRFDWTVEKADDDTIWIDGKEVKIYHEKDPTNIAWGDDVGAVAECTGFYNGRAAAERHFSQNPDLELVVLSAPGKGEMKTLVMGINHTDYKPGDLVVSNASCTTKALAMPIQVLLDSGYKVHAVLMDTTHAATNTSKPLDFMAKYGLLDTIGSAATGAAIATTKVIPYLEGKMGGFAMRVPTRDGSFANVYLVIEGADVSVDALNNAFIRGAADPKYCGRIVVFDGKEISSPDIIGNTASSVMALSKTSSIALPFAGADNPAYKTALAGFVSGYDNERGPAKDLAMLIRYAMDVNAGR